jgi:hypothetical protein
MRSILVLELKLLVTHKFRWDLCLVVLRMFYIRFVFDS